MKKNWLFFIFFIFPILLFGQENPLKMRIYLIGDAGEMKNGIHPVVEDLKSRLPAEKAKKTHLIYLGDNIYPLGMPEINEKSRKEAETILKTQLDLWPSLTGNIWMLPGNHDWKKGKPNGWNAVLRAQEFVRENYSHEKVQWLPKDACPGPVPVHLNENTLLILLDSQWWLHKNDKPEKESDCEYGTEEEILDGLALLLEENKEKIVLVAMHHPMRAFGPHNGGYSWKDHIFPFTALSHNLYIPLPIIGSIYPLYRTWFGSVQDIPNRRYQAMIEALEKILSQHPNVIHLAGHEHGLFYTKEEDRHYIVSGAGSKKTHIRKKNLAAFADAQQGYAFLDFYKNQRITLNYLIPGELAPIYEVELFVSVEKDSIDMN